MNNEANLTARGAARMQALTAAATELFLDQGFEAVSIDSLIAHVGGSRRNIYQRFGGKEGLFIQVVTLLCEEQAKPLRDLDIGNGDLETALIAFGEKVLDVVLQPRTLALHRLMITEGKRFPELSQAVLRSGHDTGVKIVEDALSRRQHGLRQDLPLDVLAEQFVTLLTAAAQLRALVGLENTPVSSVEISRRAREAVSTFLHGAQSDLRRHNA